MLHCWLTEDLALYRAVDDGNVGQHLRFFQGWVMFANPSSGSRQRWCTVSADVGSGGPLLDALASVAAGAAVVKRDDIGEVIHASVSTVYPTWR